MLEAPVRPQTAYLQDFRYIEFMITYQCNYSCSYCFWAGDLSRDAYMFRNRGPKLPRTRIEKMAFPLLKKLGLFSYADAFRNYPLQDWVDLWKALYKNKNAYLSFTGGEPLIYWKQIVPMIEGIRDVSKDFIIRFDTNGSIVPDFPAEIRSRMSYNVSFHPTQVKDRETLLGNLNKLSKQGTVFMINRVVCGKEMDGIEDEVEYFRREGYYLNINPINFKIQDWTDPQKDLLKQMIGREDYVAKIEKKTVGRLCQYPQFGLQIFPNGWAWQHPCNKKTLINIMRTKDPSPLLSKEMMACPYDNCVCFHQYSFLKGSKRNLDSMDLGRNYAISQADHRGQKDLVDKLNV